MHRLISALEERGFIRRLPNRARALEVVKLPEDVVTGSSRAGSVTTKPANANDVAVPPASVRASAPAPANDVIELPCMGGSPLAPR